MFRHFRGLFAKERLSGVLGVSVWIIRKAKLESDSLYQLSPLELGLLCHLPTFHRPESLHHLDHVDLHMSSIAHVVDCTRFPNLLNVNSGCQFNPWIILFMPPAVLQHFATSEALLDLHLADRSTVSTGNFKVWSSKRLCIFRWYCIISTLHFHLLFCLFILTYHFDWSFWLTISIVPAYRSSLFIIPNLLIIVFVSPNAFLVEECESARTDNIF